ncbi:MAG: hypothetical protein ACFFC3_03365 [Candidatus Odinarchaeota archaeon]
MINKKSEKPEVLKKLICLACGSKDVYSKPYKYKQLPEKKLLTKFRNKRALKFLLDVPICFNCNKKFHKWKTYIIFSILIFIIGILGVIIGIFYLILHQIFGDLGVKIIGIGFLVIISSIISRYILGKIEFNPNNYFFYDFVGRVFYVKPSEKKDWIPYNIWIKNMKGK